VLTGLLDPPDVLNVPVAQRGIIRCDLATSLRLARSEHSKIITDGEPTVAFPRNQPRPRRVVEALAEGYQLLQVHSG
jgi:hypothetical protein